MDIVYDTQKKKANMNPSAASTLGQDKVARWDTSVLLLVNNHPGSWTEIVLKIK